MDGHRKKASRKFALLCGIALVLSLPGGPEVARAEGGSETGLIAFSHDPDGDTQIYTVSLPGKEVTQLTGTTPLEATSGSPRWSPDGSRLLFASDRDGDWDLYTMAEDGSDVVQVSDRDGDQLSGAWSPNGRRIAFVEEGSVRTRIHLMRSNGDYLRRLPTGRRDINSDADWAPCRGSILFTARKTERNWSRTDSYLFRVGRNRVRKLEGGSGDMRWNRGCKRLIFSSSAGPPPESRSLFTISRKGRGLRVVPTEFAKTYDHYHDNPAWSADGTRIAYGYMDHGCFYCNELRVFDPATGEDQTILEANEVWFWDLDWQP